jgi:hypothetical protein
MMTPTSGSAINWFKRVLWIGILANLALAVPTLFSPAELMAMSGLPPATPLLWPRFAALLLILLSIFYMPAGVDPARYRITAWTAVGARLAGVIFFVGFQAREYHMLGYFDLIFCIPEAVLLSIGLRQLDASSTAISGGASI